MPGMLEVLFRSHYELLCAFAYRYVDCSDGAEDVVQDVFVRLCRRPPLWQECRDPQRYLYAAVRNRALKRQAHDRLVRDRLARLRQHGSMSGSQARPDEEMAAGELLDAFRVSVERLPCRRREAYTRHWNGRTKTEIADEMRISVRTVETHVAQARKTLRQELGALGAEASLE